MGGTFRACLLSSPSRVGVRGYRGGGWGVPSRLVSSVALVGRSPVRSTLARQGWRRQREVGQQESHAANITSSQQYSSIYWHWGIAHSYLSTDTDSLADS